jgi:hypothetical protein
MLTRGLSHTRNLRTKLIVIIHEKSDVNCAAFGKNPLGWFVNALPALFPSVASPIAATK